MVATGETRKILTGQCRRGFAFVDDNAMENVLTMKGKEVPPGGDKTTDRKVELTLACMKAFARFPSHLREACLVQSNTIYASICCHSKSQLTCVLSVNISKSLYTVQDQTS